MSTVASTADRSQEWWRPTRRWLAPRATAPSTSTWTPTARLWGWLVLSLIALLGSIRAAHAGAPGSITGDAAALPVVAMVAMTLAVLRRCPDRTVEETRPVGPTVTIGLAVAAFALTAACVLVPSSRPMLLGPAISVATVGMYLAAWGTRSPALLRSVVILGLLTWGTVAEAVESIVRTSLELPSGMIYRRLATAPVIGAVEEPWRLYTAMLHHGSLVVITAVTIGVAASRWRISVRTVLEVGITAFAALVVHHAVVLASPVDAYAPAGVQRWAVHPFVEAAIGVAAAVALTVIRSDRSARRAAVDAPVGIAGETPAPAVDHARDPYIFDVTGPSTGRAATAVLVASASPMCVIALALIA